ncbi:MAG: HlyD family efflux transporter periplasmic adaptor subunit [bacterium]
MDKENKNEIKKVQIKNSLFSNLWVRTLTAIITILVLLGLFTFWRMSSGKINIENSTIQAPVINLSSSTSGILEETYVSEGDSVVANTPLAKVGNEIITSKVDGIIVSVNKQQGQFFAVGSPVVSMINTNEERVVGKIDEDKGLVDIKVGQPATFTVDAFGSQKFYGVVSEVSPMSDQSSIVFSISDKREIKQFDVKVKFDVNKYKMFKQGMSAKIKVFTK